MILFEVFSFPSVKDLIKSSIENVVWQDSQGILRVSDGTAGLEGHGRLVRAFTTVYELSTNDTALQDYIRAFVAVQYNGLLDLASNGDAYAGSWSGPPTSYSYSGESSAANALLAGLVMANGVSGAQTLSSLSSSPSSTSSSSQLSKSGTNSGAIAGGVIGGIIVLAMMATLTFLIIRNRNRRFRRAAMPNALNTGRIDILQSMGRISLTGITAVRSDYRDKPPPDSVPSTITSVLPSTNPPTDVPSAPSPPMTPSVSGVSGSHI